MSPTQGASRQEVGWGGGVRSVHTRAGEWGPGSRGLYLGQGAWMPWAMSEDTVSASPDPRQTMASPSSGEDLSLVASSSL